MTQSFAIRLNDHGIKKSAEQDVFMILDMRLGGAARPGFAAPAWAWDSPGANGRKPSRRRCFASGISMFSVVFVHIQLSRKYVPGYDGAHIGNTVESSALEGYVVRARDRHDVGVVCNDEDVAGDHEQLEFVANTLHLSYLWMRRKDPERLDDDHWDMHIVKFLLFPSEGKLETLGTHLHRKIDVARGNALSDGHAREKGDHIDRKFLAHLLSGRDDVHVRRTKELENFVKMLLPRERRTGDGFLDAPADLVPGELRAVEKRERHRTRGNRRTGVTSKVRRNCEHRRALFNRGRADARVCRWRNVLCEDLATLHHADHRHREHAVDFGQVVCPLRGLAFGAEHGLVVTLRMHDLNAKMPVLHALRKRRPLVVKGDHCFH